MRLEDFIKTHAQLRAPPLVPEIRLHLASEVLPLWRATEEQFGEIGRAPPYWAFAWAGGQALARYILDHPETVRNRRVLDIGAGGGLVAIAASKAGAASVLAADIDSLACAAVRLNAPANGRRVEVTQEDLIGSDGDWNVILIGDLFYERPLAERLRAWLIGLDVPALLGDPGRNYFPETQVERLATYNVQTSRDLEDREVRQTGVYRFIR